MDEPYSKMIPEMVDQKKVPKKKKRMLCDIIWRNHADKINISEGSVHKKLTEDLGKGKVCARFVPHFLTEDQKAQRIAASNCLIEMAGSDEVYLDLIVMSDESWCYEYDPSMKCQSSVWLSTKAKKPQKVRSVKSKTKTMLIVFSIQKVLSTTNSFLGAK